MKMNNKKECLFYLGALFLYAYNSFFVAILFGFAVFFLDKFSNKI